MAPLEFSTAQEPSLTQPGIDYHQSPVRGALRDACLSFQGVPGSEPDPRVGPGSNGAHL